MKIISNNKLQIGIILSDLDPNKSRDIPYFFSEKYLHTVLHIDNHVTYDAEEEHKINIKNKNSVFQHV